MKLFVSPHNDDAVLFGAYTLQRVRPDVVTVFDSYVQVNRGHQACTAEARRAEDIVAMSLLGCAYSFGYVRDDAADRNLVELVLSKWRRVTDVWLPAVEEGGHEQHNLVGEIGEKVFRGAKIHRYLTYTQTGKSTVGREVVPSGAMVRMKLLALACYKTQLEIDALGCWPHFMDLREYVAE